MSDNPAIFAYRSKKPGIRIELECSVCGWCCDVSNEVVFTVGVVRAAELAAEDHGRECSGRLRPGDTPLSERPLQLPVRSGLSFPRRCVICGGDHWSGDCGGSYL